MALFYSVVIVVLGGFIINNGEFILSLLAPFLNTRFEAVCVGYES